MQEVKKGFRGQPIPTKGQVAVELKAKVEGLENVMRKAVQDLGQRDLDVHRMLSEEISMLRTLVCLPRAEVAELNDFVLIDFIGCRMDANGNPALNDLGMPDLFEGGFAENSLVFGLGVNKTFIEGFEEQIVGKKVGETFDVPVIFPEDYAHESLKGNKVNFTVTLKSVIRPLPTSPVQELKDKSDAARAAKVGELKAAVDTNAAALSEVAQPSEEAKQAQE